MLPSFETNKIELSFAEMPKDEPFICSFSGGKDSSIALSMALERGTAKGLIHWYDKEKNSSIFHSQDFSVISCQAYRIGLSLNITYYTPWKHRLELLRAYQKIASEGVKSIIFGDINLCDSVKFQNIICEKAGLVPRYPLWGKDYDWLFAEMKKRRIKPVITRVNTSMLGERFLGKTFDSDIYKQLKELDVDPFGEKGEYHTTVVDADFYTQPLEYTLGKECLDNEICLTLSSHYHENSIYRLL